MRVFVLEHRDIEDDKYVRGVYARAEDAEVDVATDEVSENWILERYAAGRTIFGRRTESSGERVVDVQTVRTHYEGCCGVTGMDVLEKPVGTLVLEGAFVRDGLS